MPQENKILVCVYGATGSGKSAICGEIEIALRALGLQVTWANGDQEKRMTHADWAQAIELYEPEITIMEYNIPRAIKRRKL